MEEAWSYSVSSALYRSVRPAEKSSDVAYLIRKLDWRAGASLPSRPNGAIFLYIYPALMYAVMFYVILNKGKLHFPLAKNVMHSPSK